MPQTSDHHLGGRFHRHWIAPVRWRCGRWFLRLRSPGACAQERPCPRLRGLRICGGGGAVWAHAIGGPAVIVEINVDSRGQKVIWSPGPLMAQFGAIRLIPRGALAADSGLMRPQTMWATSAEGLAKSYGSTEAVAGLDLEVPVGETLALLGMNGAGKSTAIGLMLGLLMPDRGHVEVGARPLIRAVSEDSSEPCSKTPDLMPGVRVGELWPRYGLSTGVPVFQRAGRDGRSRMPARGTESSGSRADKRRGFASQSTVAGANRAQPGYGRTSAPTCAGAARGNACDSACKPRTTVRFRPPSPGLRSQRC